MWVESCIHSHYYSSVLLSVTWKVPSSVPRCVLTSWSTAKRCCCRAQPRPSSASASSARQAASQLAGTEDAQVSDILPTLKKRKRPFQLLPQVGFLFCTLHSSTSKGTRLNRGLYVFFKISHPLCHQWLTPGPPAWAWCCTCWRTALQISSGSTRVTDKAWASYRAWISCPLRSSRR